MLTTDVTKKCRKFIVFHWGTDGLKQLQERPVTWVRHEANPRLKTLRRTQKTLPLILVRGEVNRIHLELSTEHKKAGRS